MLSIAVVLFVIAAFFGLYVLLAILQNRSTPKGAVFTHGPLAALALILVLIYMFMGPGHREPLLVTSVVLFVIAALGGLTLFTIDMSKKPIPKLIAVLHPIIAVIALITLIIYMVS